MGYPADHAPHAGGVSATVAVTMTVDTLMGGLKAAQLDTGDRISPGLARRLACRAGIIPAVLGSNSQVLDLGRKTRFHTEPQRIALALEQGGCTAEGCDWPPGMCHAHHDQPFSAGGDTSVKNGRLLCPSTTPAPTTRPTRPPASPTARSASTEEREGTRAGPPTAAPSRQSQTLLRVSEPAHAEDDPDQRRPRRGSGRALDLPRALIDGFEGTREDKT